MSNPKRQHWVPRFYLRYFAIPNSNGEKVWAFHRKHGDPFVTSIDKICVERHLYSPHRTNGRDHHLETKLSGLESTLSTLWPQLASDFVDLGGNGVRKGLGLFMAIQCLRHPEHYTWLASLRTNLRHFIQKNPQNLGEAVSLRYRDEIYKVDSGWLNGDIETDRRDFVSLIEMTATDVAEELMAKRWSVVFLDDPLLITSDYPIFNIEPDLQRNQISNDKSRLIFPISPTRLLCMDNLNEPRNQYYPIPQEAADLYNYFTWTNTDGFMISPREIDRVLEGILRVRDEHERKLSS